MSNNNFICYQSQQYQNIIKSKHIQMKIKKNRNENQQAQVQILNRRTDSCGRTEYKVRWLAQNNRLSWELVSNIKQHYEQIKIFQRNYDERVNNNWIQNQSLVSNNVISFHQLEANFSNKKTLKQTVQIYDCQNSDKSQEQEPMSKISQQNNYKVQNSIKKQQFRLNANKNDKQQIKTIQNKNQKLEQIQNIVIAKRLIRKDEKLKEKNKMKNKLVSKLRSNFKNHYQNEIQKQKIIQIKQIVSIKQIYFALVTMQNNQQKFILRDELRVFQPALLASYYQKLLINSMMLTDKI